MCNEVRQPQPCHFFFYNSLTLRRADGLFLCVHPDSVDIWAVCKCAYLYVSHGGLCTRSCARACRSSCGQGRRSSSGAEVRRQRQEHRPGCLDLLRLSECFVTMQDKHGGEGPRRGVHQLLALETRWQHQVVQECLMLNRAVSIAALRENHRTKEAVGRPVLMCLLVMPPINTHSSPIPFRTSNP